MIKKPCFHLSDHDDGWNDDRIHECGPKPLCTRAGKKLYWSTCNSGKLHPFYANWQRMFETPAAGLWRTDMENAPGDNTPLLYQVWDDSLSLKSFIVSTKYLIQFRKITPVAFAKINTEGL
jgi:hypothetical protein